MQINYSKCNEFHSSIKCVFPQFYNEYLDFLSFTMFDLTETMEKWCIFFWILGLGATEKCSRVIPMGCFAKLIFYVQILVIMSLSILMVLFYRYLYFYLDAMGAVNDIIKYAATVMATISILVESHLKEEQLREINELATEFQQDMLLFIKRKDLRRYNKAFWKDYKTRFTYLTALYLISELVLVPIYVKNTYYRLSLIFLMCNNIFIGICRYRHLQHILYMNLVHYQLKLMVKVLRNGHGLTNVKLRRLQELFGMGANMVRLQNNFFGWSQTMNLVFNHLQLLGDAYWIYWRFLNGCCNPGFYSE